MAERVGFLRFLTIKLIDAMIVLMAVLIITVALFSGTLAEIKKQMIIDTVKQQVLNNPELVARLGDKVKEYIMKKAEILIKAQGLDKPWYENLPYYLMSVITLDLRAQVLRSNTGSQIVRDIVMERLPNTVLLFTTGTLVTMAIGVLLGVYVANKRGSILDKTVTLGALITTSLPMWWLGMVMLQVFAFQLHLFPPGGMMSIPPPKDPIARALDVLYHMTLPLLTFVAVTVGGWAYVTRNLVLGILKEDFVLAAKARGLPRRRILLKYVLRPALPPIITMMALSLAGSLGGAIITETVFNWPGMGMLYWEAISALDVPVILGITYVLTLVFVIAMVLVDIAYGLLDPRIRKGMGQ